MTNKMWGGRFAQGPAAIMAKINASIDFTNMHPIDAIKYNIMPAYNGGLRPKRSSKGPYKNCPKQIPIKKLDRERPTRGMVVCKSFAMPGNPGKYISMENGPIADSRPRIRIVKNFCFPFIH